MQGLIKYAGGKQKQLKYILPYFKNGLTLVEPFLGAGNICLNYNTDTYYLNDYNTDLYYLWYYTLFSNTFSFDSSKYFADENNNKDVFLSIRDKFNTEINVYNKSLYLLYLLKHGFNGLLRYNKKGLINTPYAYYKTNDIINPYKHLIEIKKYFSTKQVVLSNLDVCSFIELHIGNLKNCVIYCDPPYYYSDKMYSNMLIDYTQLDDQLAYLSQYNQVIVSDNCIDPYINHNKYIEYDVKRIVNTNNDFIQKEYLIFY